MRIPDTKWRCNAGCVASQKQGVEQASLTSRKAGSENGCQRKADDVGNLTRTHEIAGQGGAEADLCTMSDFQGHFRLAMARDSEKRLIVRRLDALQWM
jgi:hypothetical protein